MGKLSLNVSPDGPPLLKFYIIQVINLLKKSPKFPFDISPSVGFVTRLIEQLEADRNCTVFKGNSENDFRTRTVVEYDRNKFNKDLQTYEKRKQGVQTMADKQNDIERHFNIIDRQLQWAIKKKMFVCMCSFYENHKRKLYIFHSKHVI